MRASIARSTVTARIEGLDVLIDAATDLNIRNLAVHREHGKTRITGIATYQLDRELFFDVIKDLDGWESEVLVEIEVERHDVRGYHTVQAGETLAAIAKRHLGRESREMEIFESNRDRMNDPDQVSPGLQLLIPWS